MIVVEEGRGDCHVVEEGRGDCHLSCCGGREGVIVVEEGRGDCCGGREG